MRIEFEVRGHLPPKKDGATSMWSKDRDVAPLAALRRGALRGNPSGQALSHGIRLLVEVHVPNPEGRAAGDLDNYVTGVCDGLMRAADRVGLNAQWTDPELADVHPEKAIAIDDDRAVVEIVARKIDSITLEPWYRVVLEGEREPETAR